MGLNTISKKLVIVIVNMMKTTKELNSSDDSILLNKMIYFPTVTVIIRCVFEKNEVCYPQVYLDNCMYQI